HASRNCRNSCAVRGASEGGSGCASVLPRERRPIGVSLLEERVAPLDGFVGAVREPRGLPREDLLPDETVVDRVERELEHANGRRRLRQDLARPLEGGRL